MAKEEAARSARSDGRAKVAKRPLWPRRRPRAARGPTDVPRSRSDRYGQGGGRAQRAVRRTCQGREATVMAKEEAARSARSDGRAKVAKRPLWPNAASARRSPEQSPKQLEDARASQARIRAQK